MSAYIKTEEASGDQGKAIEKLLGEPANSILSPDSQHPLEINLAGDEAIVIYPKIQKVSKDKVAEFIKDLR